MSRTVRLGGCAAGWGDVADAPVAMINDGVDYLGYDFLSELSLPMLAKRRSRNGSGEGHVPDVANRIRNTLDAAGDGRVRVTTNAGALNPLAARRAVARALVERGYPDAPVGAITGDDVLGRLAAWRADGVELTDDDAGVAYDDIAGALLYANAYFGAAPVADCIRQGARVITAGRITDSALFLGPLLAEFGWTDHDLVATGFVVGHLLECSGQMTGGASNFWRDVPEPWNTGYPIAEVGQNGSVLITKAAGTGGLVSRGTVIEQLLYEVHDPATYLSPDVVADFTGIEVEELGPDRVAVRGVRGRAAPSTTKVVLGFHNGWIGTGTIMFSWPDAAEKARRAEEIVRHRLDIEGVRAEELRFEYIGLNALHGPMAPEPDPDSVNEVMLRVTARCRDRAHAEAIAPQMLPLFLMGPATPAGLGSPAPVREAVAQVSVLVPSELVRPQVHVAAAGAAAAEEDS